ncbi:hypothetical protein ACFE04_009736 [Oxalis oulophora]
MLPIIKPVLPVTTFSATSYMLDNLNVKKLVLVVGQFHRGSSLFDLMNSETSNWNSRKAKHKHTGPQGRLETLLSQTNNKVCADCGSPNPKWVRKYELEFCDSCENNTMICTIPPKSSSSTFASILSLGHRYDKKGFDKQGTKHHRIGAALRNSWGSKKDIPKKSTSMAGMIEFIGLIKVNVVKGMNLAVRDVMTSDPYVILSLGQQSVKTRVIKSSLNPVWNESLMLSIPEDIPPLKILVYDKDTFSTDDFMGEAEIDIEPLVTAAKAHERSSINEPMQLGKLVASKENTLVSDGIINLIDGKVKQEVSLRLQNVERGVLDILLECVPLTQ